MTQAEPEVRDIAIVGGGPVGLALACQLLLATDWRITLIDAATPARAARDPRAIALSHGSRQLLEQIGAWPVAGTAIEHIHVSQRGHLGHVKLHHEDYGVPALGYVVRYGELCNVLERALGRAVQRAGAERLHGLAGEDDLAVGRLGVGVERRRKRRGGNVEAGDLGGRLSGREHDERGGRGGSQQSGAELRDHSSPPGFFHDGHNRL